VRGHADPGLRSEQRARGLGRHRVEAQVRTAGAGRERHVDAAIHHDAHGAAACARAAARGREERVHVLEQRLPLELARSDLDQVHAARDRRLHGGREIAAGRRAVGHEREAGPRERRQNVASPSSGLDALA
jgi:hypothetical protein